MYVRTSRAVRRGVEARFECNKAKTLADSYRPKIYGLPRRCRVSREIRRLFFFLRDVSLLCDWKRIRIVCSSPVSACFSHWTRWDKRSPDTKKNTIGIPRADLSGSRCRRRASSRFLRNELSPLGRTRGKGHIARRATSSAPALVSGISRRRALDTGARATA